MCVLAFAWQQHVGYPLILVGNRDEFHRRPAAPAGWWDDAPDILAGRDLQAGGTWMGFSRSGRFAVVTNFREPPDLQPDSRSRGELVSDFLGSRRPPRSWQDTVEADAYGAFNLIFGDPSEIRYMTNRGPASGPLAAGVYGLSNHLLNTAWPKVTKTREGLRACIGEQTPDVECLFSLLLDDEIVPDDDLPDTGVPRAWERRLSPVFIRSPLYGTRSATVMMLSRDGQAFLEERTFDRDGRPAGSASFAFGTDRSEDSQT
jgi:uncharacterized protein with NRDE domain